MTTFDSLLGHVRDAATDLFGDDGDELLDRAQDFLGDRGDGGPGGNGSGSGAGGFDWGEALSSFLGDDAGANGNGGGGGRDGGDPGGDDGWGFLGRAIERFSGGGDDAAGGGTSRFASLLPDELRGIADDLLGPEAATWAGRLVDPGGTDAPEGWPALLGAARSLGLGDDAAGDGPAWSPSRLFDLAGPLTEGLTPLLGADPDLARLAAAAGVDVPGLPDLQDLAVRGGAVAPVRPAGEPLDPDPLGAPDLRHAVPDDAGAPGPEPVDYDELVTSGAGNPGHDAYDAPDPTPHDPTFPDDPAPAPPPADDFHQAIDDADQVEASMDAVFEGPS